MSYRIAINGYGRIGQCVLRALYSRGLQEKLIPVALNELSDLDTIAYLTRYDSTHGRFPLAVEKGADNLQIAGQSIRVMGEAQPENLPWKALDIDLLLECSGSFTEREQAQAHLAAGARRLLFSQPARPDVDATVVYGFNHTDLEGHERIVSAASCTTNCVIPVLDLLDRNFGIEAGVTTTIHSAMNDQPVIDAYHRSDLRLTRSAMQSIIPVDTGLDRGIERLLPQLAGRFQCLHVRVPTPNVSLMDLSIRVKHTTDVASVNAVLREASLDPRWMGILGFTEEPHASVDFNHDAHSGVVDGTQTRVAEGQLIKILCWFDNEWAFANRMLDVAEYWLSRTSNH